MTDQPNPFVTPSPALDVTAALKAALAPAAAAIANLAKSSVPLDDNSAEGCAARAAAADHLKSTTSARLATELEQARAEWTELRGRCADSPALVAVLIIHQPWATYDGRIGCTECIEADDREGITNVNWPCDTYGAIRKKTS